jgi:antitoxin HigA-1
MTKKFAPVHPGEILLEEFLKPLGISQYRLASDTGVHPRRINEIVHGNRTITADTALRLSRYFGLSERFWLNLQARYDLEVEKDRLEGRLEKRSRSIETIQHFRCKANHSLGHVISGLTARQTDNERTEGVSAHALDIDNTPCNLHAAESNFRLFSLRQKPQLR